jgi:hypothetical protein
MKDTTHLDELPTSFGTFKPKGHILLALKSKEQSDALRKDLLDAGWAESAINDFTPRETLEELQAMVDNASGAAGFGYEITLMRRYLKFAREGHSWLLVKAEEDERAEEVARIAKLHGAPMAVHYRTFTVEELI